MARNQFIEAIIEERSLQEIRRIWVCAEVVKQALQGITDDEHVAVDTEHELAAGLLKQSVPDGGAQPMFHRHVAVIRNEFFERFERSGARAVGMVVNDNEFHVVEDLGMIEPQGLQAEISPVIIIVGCHADGERTPWPVRRRRRNFVPSLFRALFARDGGSVGKDRQQPPDRRCIASTVEQKADQHIDDSFDLAEVAITQDQRRRRPRQPRYGGQAAIVQVPGVKVAFHQPEARLRRTCPLDRKLRACLEARKDDKVTPVAFRGGNDRRRSDHRGRTGTDRWRAMECSHAGNGLGGLSLHDHGTGQADNLRFAVGQCDDFVTEIIEAVRDQPGNERRFS